MTVALWVMVGLQFLIYLGILAVYLELRRK